MGFPKRHNREARGDFCRALTGWHSASVKVETSAVPRLLLGFRIVSLDVNHNILPCIAHSSESQHVASRGHGGTSIQGGLDFAPELAPGCRMCLESSTYLSSSDDYSRQTNSMTRRQAGEVTCYSG